MQLTHYAVPVEGYPGYEIVYYGDYCFVRHTSIGILGHTVGSAIPAEEATEEFVKELIDGHECHPSRYGEKYDDDDGYAD